jgi:hypothetical protein
MVTIDIKLEVCMNRSTLKPLAVAMALAATTIIAGCDSHTDKISSIVNSPSNYSGKDVVVAGEVTKVYELPLGITDIAAYRLNDGSGQIWVLTHAGAPREGDKLGVKATVRPEGAIAGTTLGTILDEKNRKLN